jgi:hypothetical protein
VASSARNEYMGLQFFCPLDKFNSPYFPHLGHYSRSKFLQKNKEPHTILFVESLLTLQLPVPPTFLCGNICALEFVVIAGDRPVVFVNLTGSGAPLSFTRPKECTKYHSLVQAHE